MQKLLFTIFFLGFSLYLQAQPNAFFYRVDFTDKNNSNFSLERPLEFLTQKSLDRRAYQGITLDSLDLPVNEWYVDSVLAHNSVLVHRTKWFNGITVKVAPVDTLAFRDVENLPFVKEIKLVRIGSSSKMQNKFALEEASTAPIDPIYTPNYGMGFRQIEMLQLDLLHNLGFRGEGKVIAILDNGYRGIQDGAAFDSMISNGQLLGYFDFVDGDSNVFNDATHGTTVLSTIAANDPGFMIGAAPKASFYLFNTEDNQSESPLEEDHWTRAAEYADSLGVDALNTSLGYNTFDDPQFNFTYEDLDGETTRISVANGIAASKGMLVVSSAGNEGRSSWFHITAPADAKGAMIAGAVHDDEIATSFTSRGPTADGRLKPDLCAMGSDVIVANQNGNYVRTSGTSFAAPILAGAALSLWSAYSDRSSAEIIEMLVQSGDRYSNSDTIYGHGIPNVYTALLRGSNADTFVYHGSSNEAIVYPNPVEDQAKIYFGIVPAGTYFLSISDAFGNLIYRVEVEQRDGNYLEFDIPYTQKLARGGYVATLHNQNFKEAVRFFKL